MTELRDEFDSPWKRLLALLFTVTELQQFQANQQHE
jgi:hypothetical protein